MRCWIPPIGLIVNVLTPSARMHSRIWFEDNDDEAMATTLRCQSSAFSWFLTPFISPTLSQSTSPAEMESRIFSTSAPSAREHILRRVLGFYAINSGMGSGSWKGTLFWLGGLVSFGDFGSEVGFWIGEDRGGGVGA